MSEFRARYVNNSGEIVSNTFNSVSEADLRHRLSEQGCYVYSIDERGKGLSLAWGDRSRRKKVKSGEFIIFNQQFLALVHAGLPILKSLDLLTQRMRNPYFQLLLTDIGARVKSGALLSEAFEAQGVFPKVYTASLYAGEKSGNLEEVIRRYIEYQRVIDATKGKVKSAITYPIILTVLLIVLVTYLMAVVVPEFAKFYEGLNAQLPQITLTLIAISRSIRQHLLTGLILGVGGLVGLRIWSRSAKGGLTLDGIKLRLPVVGDLWNKFAFSQLSRTLSTLLSGGIPLVNSLEIVADSSGNRLITRAVKNAIVSVKEGQSLSKSLESSSVVPELAIEMVQVGESTGSLSEMLRHVADFYDEEVNTRLNQVFTYIEPILLVILATIVAFVLIALYLPIFNLSSMVR
ncbi:MAG: type II secretion system F family protein [Acidobacteria bacterium]|nr:type II secretion system F family protein [Acidobacteriota bacterium]MCI0721136.1 type II secretion system F family protein [Acidobacteriota bacterium]